MTAWSLARSFRFPNEYSLGHWLFSYRFGFTKRGLVGQLLAPFVANKSPVAVRELVAAAATVIAFAMALSVGWLADRTLRASRPASRWLVTAAWLVFASSPFLVQAGHFTGYFDQILVILTIACLAEATGASPRLWLVSLLSLVAMLVHEEFLLFGLPLIVLAVASADDVKPGWRDLAFRLAIAVEPAVVAFVIVVLVQPHFIATGVPPLTAYLHSTHALTDYGVRNSITGISLHMGNLAKSQAPNFFARLTHWEIARSILPPLAFLQIPLFLALGAYTPLVRFLAVAAAWAPLLLLITVWDTARFYSFLIWHSLVAFLLLAPKLAPPGPRTERIVLGLAALAMLANLAIPSPLMDEAIPGRLALFSIWTPFAPCRRPAFPNADFEHGDLTNWRATGTAFAAQPTRGNNVRFRYHYDFAAPEGDYWVGTFESSGRLENGATQGDEPTGELESVPFVVDGPELHFLVGGGRDVGKTYVAVEVDGHEVFRAAGKGYEELEPVKADLSGYRGKQAIIRIVDNGRDWLGHINADAFCWDAPSRR